MEELLDAESYCDDLMEFLRVIGSLLFTITFKEQNVLLEFTWNK